MSNRAVRALQELFVNDRRALVQRHLHRGVLDGRDALFVDARELTVRLVRAREPLERSDGVLVARVLRERASAGLERRAGVVERRLLKLGDAMQKLDLARGVRREANLNLVNGDELIVRSGLAIHGLEDLGHRGRVLGLMNEALERLQRRGVGRVAREHLAVDLHRGVHLRHLLFAQLREAKHELRLLVSV